MKELIEQILTAETNLELAENARKACDDYCVELELAIGLVECELKELIQKRNGLCYNLRIQTAKYLNLEQTKNEIAEHLRQPQQGE